MMKTSRLIRHLSTYPYPMWIATCLPWNCAPTPSWLVDRSRPSQFGRCSPSCSEATAWSSAWVTTYSKDTSVTSGITRLSKRCICIQERRRCRQPCTPPQLPSTHPKHLMRSNSMTLRMKVEAKMLMICISSILKKWEINCWVKLQSMVKRETSRPFSRRAVSHWGHKLHSWLKTTWNKRQNYSNQLSDPSHAFISDTPSLINTDFCLVSRLCARASWVSAEIRSLASWKMICWESKMQAPKLKKRWTSSI